MIRLLAYMSTPGGLTGAPRRLLTLAASLRNQGVETDIVSQSGSDLLREAQTKGFETAAVDATGVLALRRGALFGGGVVFRLRVAFALVLQQWRVFRCIQRQRANAVWIRGSKGIAFAVVGTYLSGRPLIWDVDYELPSTGRVRWLHRFGLWAATFVVFQYGAAAEAIFGRDLVGKYCHKFRTLVPGIDFAPLQAVVETAEGDATVHDDRPFTIIQVGTLCERKNQRHTVEALGRLDRANLSHPIRLLLVGGEFDPNYPASLRPAIRSLGLEDVVEFLGWRDDVHQLIASADLMVMPSVDEGVPNAVQEAMYLGIPAIVSPAGGMPEVIKHGETGWVLPLSKPTAWAAQIKECIEAREHCSRVGQQASEYANRHFSVEAWGREYAELVRAAVTPRRRVP